MTANEFKVIGLLVTYNTPGEALRLTVARLVPQLSRLLILDNSDRSTEVAEIFSATPLEGVEYRPSGGNIGIAEAQNNGIVRATELGADFVLFLDDDSSFPDGGVARLLKDLKEERINSPETVGIGPRIVDERTGQVLAPVWEGRKIRPGTVTAITEVAYLVSSGALVDVTAFEKYGLFKGEYFIDHVDKEWGLRVGLQGGRFVASSSATMSHQLGDAPTTSRSGNVRYRHDSPIRDYYLTRNAIFVMRDLRFPPIKYVDMLRLLLDSSARKIFGRSRSTQQRRAVLLGLAHGLRNRRGPR